MCWLSDHSTNIRRIDRSPGRTNCLYLSPSDSGCENRLPAIDRVILVGGSTRMPMISRMLQQLTGKPANVVCILMKPWHVRAPSMRDIYCNARKQTNHRSESPMSTHTVWVSKALISVRNANKTRSLFLAIQSSLIRRSINSSPRARNQATIKIIFWKVKVASLRIARSSVRL